MSKLTPWLISALALALAVAGFFLWRGQAQITQVTRQKDAAEASLDTAVQANAAQGRLIGQMQAQATINAGFTHDREIIVQNHYITERTLQTQLSTVHEERTNANLEDGPASPDLRLAFRGLRRVLAANPDGLSSGNSASPPAN